MAAGEHHHHHGGSEGARRRKSVEALEMWSPNRSVRRVASMSMEEVTAKYLVAGEGEPLVVTGEQASWFGGDPSKRWTVASLGSRYGSDEVLVSDRAPLCEWDDPPMRTRRVRVSEYAAYCRGDATSLEGGLWYLNSWTPFSEHPELLREWRYPSCVEDALKHDADADESRPPPRHVVDYSKVFVGVAGCETRLHFDSMQTHAWLAQIEGRKQVVLFAPRDSDKLRLHGWEELFDGGGAGLRRAIDLAALPDATAYPELRNAVPYVATLDPGDLLLIPRGWWHYARCLDVCVTLMRNFANSANAAHFRAAMTRASDHAERCKPKLIGPTVCVNCRMSQKNDGRGRSYKAKPCSRCRAVVYCGRDCQKAHFAKHHKHVCTLLAEVCAPLDGKNAASRSPESNPAESSPTDASLHPSERLFAASHSTKDAPTFAKAILRPGRGRFTPTADSLVRVHYETFLADGQKIDSSIDQGKPIDFHITNSTLAPGWRDATKTMLVGEKARVVVPPRAAYGDRGVPDKVPPNTALIFTVELLDVF